MVWQEVKGGEPHLFGGKYSVDQNYLIVNDLYNNSYMPQLCCNKDGAVVAWQYGPARQANTFVGKFTGTSLNSVVEYKNLNSTQSNLCCIGNAAMVIFHSQVPFTTDDLYASYYPSQGGNSQLIAQRIDAIKYQLTCCNNGIVYLLWKDGGGYPLKSSYAATMPLDFNLSLQQSSTPNITQATINPFGGIRPYTISVNGHTIVGNTINLTAGTYTISVTDSSNPPATVTKTITIPSITCPCMNRLSFVNKYSNGAPVQSVSWSCPTDDCPYNLVATGGYKGMLPTEITPSSIRVYSFDDTTKKLVPLFAALPTDYIYSVDWCCINGVPYLAVAGCPDQYGNSVWIYRYDLETNTMMLVSASNAHQSIVYSVAWLCDGCTTNPNIRNLAIGGDVYDGAEFAFYNLIVLNKP